MTGSNENKNLSHKNNTKEEAEALLTVEGLKSKKAATDSIYVIAIVTILLFIGIVYFSLIAKPTKTTPASNGSTSLPSSTNNPLSNNGSIDSQAKYCSNPVNANLVC